MSDLSRHNSCTGCTACSANEHNEDLCAWGYRWQPRIIFGETTGGTPLEPCPKPLSAEEEEEKAEHFRGVCNCGKLGIWFYMPSVSDPDWNPYCCDDCVPRGCSCNLGLKEGVEEIFDEQGCVANPPEDYDEILDEQGRKWPCCEWDRIEREGEH